MDVKENEQMISEMLTRAEKAEEPAVEKVVSKGDESQPAPMTFSSLKSAGYSYIYDSKTGDRSMTNNNMLTSQLKKTRPDGTRVFTTINPNITPRTGFLQCLLHPENPEREHFNDMGLPVCKKSNLINEYQRTRHMQKKHKDEWAAIESERKAKENKGAQILLERLAKNK